MTLCASLFLASASCKGNAALLYLFVVANFIRFQGMENIVISSSSGVRTFSITALVGLGTE